MWIYDCKNVKFEWLINYGITIAKVANLLGPRTYRFRLWNPTILQPERSRLKFSGPGTAFRCVPAYFNPFLSCIATSSQRLIRPVTTYSYAMFCVEMGRGKGLSVRLSVRLSHAWIVPKRKKNQSRFFTPYERSFSLVFWEEEWFEGRPLLPDVLGQLAPVGAKSPIVNR